MRTFAGTPKEGGRPYAVGLVLLIAFAVAILGAAPARAATTYQPIGAFDEEALEIGQIAVDDSTGDILVIKGERVQVFAPQGNSATPIAEFSGGFPAGIAVDQASHAVYVSEPSAGKITRYVSDGANPPTYTADPTFVSPVQGTDPAAPHSAEEIGSFASPIAVDPTDGDLLIGDTVKNRVSRFTPSGAFVGNFDGSGSLAGAFHHILGIAVDAGGAVYVIDNTTYIEGSSEGSLPFNGSSVLERFAADGTPDNSFDPRLDQPAAVGFDSKAGNLVVVGHLTGFFYDQQPPHLTVFHGDDIIAGFDYPAAGNIGTQPTGIAADNVSGRLYVANSKIFGFGTAGVQVYEPLIFPDLVLDPPTAVTATTAHVTGSINPLGAEAHYQAEYSFDGGVTWDATEAQVATGTSPVPVDIDVTGLAGNTTYRLRIGATTATGTFHSPEREFDTSASGPGVFVGGAGDRTATGATINGKVNPYGLQTGYHFEYGLTTAYGSRLPLTYEDAIGQGRTAIVVSKVLTGLQPDATYHYRLVATNSVGTTTSEDRTFTTTAAAVPHRVYEQVTPVDKDGANIEENRGFQASLSGNQIFYSAKSPIGGEEVESEGAPLLLAFSATRGTNGWKTIGVDPPVRENYQAVKWVGTLANAADGSKSFVASLKRLAPGANEGDSNFYLRDSATGAYTTVISVPGPFFYANAIGTVFGNSPFVAGTPNFSHIVFQSKFFEELVPGTPGGAVFEWDEGQVKVVSVLPGGAEVAAKGLAMSADGSKVLFEAEGTLYDRIGGSRTVTVPGTYAGVTADGQQVFTTGTELTADSEPGVLSLYRYDVESEETELLTAIGPGAEVLHVQTNELSQYVVSANGATAVFVSKLNLAVGGAAGVESIYAWHEGAVRHIGTLQPGREQVRAQVSPNGRYVALATYSQLTEYDNSSTACNGVNDVEGHNPVACREIYRYDAAAGEVLCASCRPDGGSPTGQAQFRPSEGKIDFGNPHLPRQIIDDGELFFDTTDPLVAADTNGGRDVYAFNGEQAHLISSGRGNGGSQFVDASPDGRNVFFVTTDRLVGQDDDALADLYDARIEGGIASQNPPQPRGECIRDDCKATPSVGPELPFGGSEGLNGPANVKAPKPSCGKGRRWIKSQCVKEPKKKQHKRAKRDRRQAR